MSAIATYRTHSGKRRLFRCRTCETPFAETRATVFFALRPSEEHVMRALKRLRVRGDLAGICWGLGVTDETGGAWRRRAAPQAEALTRPLRRALPVTQVPLDERWNCIERQHARETDTPGESGPDGEEGRPGGWSSGAPALRLMSAAVVGPRTRDTAQAVVATTTARVAGRPACCSAGFTGSRAALSAACHVVTPCAPTGKRGRPRTPRGEPQPELVYGPLVTQPPQGKLLTRSTRVVLGAARLTPLGCTLSTAVVARVHLPVRQAWAPWARKTTSVWQDRTRMRQRVVFCQAFYTAARPHLSVPQPLPMPERTRHGAMRPRWRERPPAMAAGLTNHVWTFRALLTATFEP